MALKRPGGVTNLAANQQRIAGNQKFMKVEANTIELVRLLPAQEDGFLFFPVTNHHNLKDQDGENTAFACLEQHGNDKTGKRCLICAVAAKLEDTDPTIYDKIKGSTQNYVQVLRAIHDNGIISQWTRPMLLRLSKGGAENVQGILNTQRKMNQPLANDVEKGQALQITRTGTGFKTKYPVERTGDIVSLDTIRPTWAEEFMTDIYGEIGLNIEDPETQLAALKLAFPAVPFDEILEEIGFEV